MNHRVRIIEFEVFKTKLFFVRRILKEHKLGFRPIFNDKVIRNQDWSLSIA